MKTIACLSTALVCLLAVGAGPAAAKNSKPPPTCSALAGVVVKEAGKLLNKTPIAPTGFTISSATPVTAAVIVASSPHLTYCQVVFQLNPAITIQVGLPLNTTDGGVGGDAGGCGLTSVTNNSCVAGNWNGRIEAVGNGGYSGSVPAVTGATDVGFVGSSTDNGHSTNWCNAIDPETGQPNAQPNCGVVGGGFELAPDDQLLPDLITDFIDTSEVEQTIWAQILTDAYYAQTASRTYWNGCSTGGRQGMQMAQFHPELFDGILAPAFNWNRFIIGEMWPPVVFADVDAVDCPGGMAEGCAKGIPAGSAFANACVHGGQCRCRGGLRRE